MENFVDSLKSFISPNLISKAAEVVGENDFNISKGISSIIPSLLGVLLKRGNTPQIKNILSEAGNLNILSDLENICRETPTKDQQRIGDDFLQHLLGDKAADFTGPIAEDAGISKPATNRLISMLAPVVAGFLGNKLIEKNWSLPELFSELNKQKSSFAKLIPSGIVKAFGLSSVLHTPNSQNEPETKKNRNWIIWVVLLLLLLLLFFLWRSCSKKSVELPPAAITDTVKVKPIEQPANPGIQRTATEVTLPGGTILKAYKGGVEDEIVKFLQSDEYKNASADDLKKKWFRFDNLAFEFNSATELKNESKIQLDNLATILNHFKDAKIMIGGFADKVGSEDVNMEISKERAKTIESMLEARGLGSRIVRTEGYGDEYAKHAASESNDARAEDREIALRFVK
jgi:Outer membrane protein and related peptidoglycan-associated (lipo)proteins